MTPKQKKLMGTLAFVFAGLLAGLAYWHFIGCSSGSCAITSKWHNSMLFGGVFGYLIGDSINWNKEKKEIESK